MLSRRGLIGGLGFMLAAPAIVRMPGLLMPISPTKLKTYTLIPIAISGSFDNGIPTEFSVFGSDGPVDLYDLVINVNSGRGPTASGTWSASINVKRPNIITQYDGRPNGQSVRVYT